MQKPQETTENKIKLKKTSENIRKEHNRQRKETWGNKRKLKKSKEHFGKSTKI